MFWYFHGRVSNDYGPHLQPWPFEKSSILLLNNEVLFYERVRYGLHWSLSSKVIGKYCRVAIIKFTYFLYIYFGFRIVNGMRFTHFNWLIDNEMISKLWIFIRIIYFYNSAYWWIVSFEMDFEEDVFWVVCKSGC